MPNISTKENGEPLVFRLLKGRRAVRKPSEGPSDVHPLRANYPCGVLCTRRVDDLPVAYRTNLYGKERNHGNRFPAQYHAFAFVYLAILQDQHDCADITLL
jgi:hypothetical protein